jgi:hypothetical protein
MGVTDLTKRYLMAMKARIRASLVWTRPTPSTHVSKPRMRIIAAGTTETVSWEAAQERSALP